MRMKRLPLCRHTFDLSVRGAPNAPKRDQLNLSTQCPSFSVFFLPGQAKKLHSLELQMCKLRMRLSMWFK